MSGSINPTSQSLEDELVRRITALESEMVQIKNAQPVGSDVVKALSMTAADGSVVGIGQLPDNSGFGFFATNSTGNILYKNVAGVVYRYDSSDNLIFMDTGQTQYVYDPTTGKNIMQIGKLPDGTYGWAVAAAGLNVADGFS